MCVYIDLTFSSLKTHRVDIIKLFSTFFSTGWHFLNGKFKMCTLPNGTTTNQFISATSIFGNRALPFHIPYANVL